MSPSIHPQRARAEGLLVGVCLVWAWSFLWVKDALADADPFTFLALRFGFGALLLTLLARRALLVPAALRGGTLLGPLLFVSYALQTVALVHTTASRSAFITGMCVVLVPFVSLVVYRRAPSLASLLGVGLAALGLYFLTLSGEAALMPRDTLYGDLLTLACAFTYAIHITLTERWASRAPALGLVGVQVWWVALLSAACLPFVEVRFASTPALWTGVLLSGALATVLALTSQTWAQARTTAVRAALIYALEPVFTAVVTSVLGREVLGGREWVGGGLVVLGVLVSETGAALWSRLRGPRVRATLG